MASGVGFTAVRARFTEGSEFRMKRVHLLLGAAVAATLASGCANCPSSPPKKSAGGTVAVAKAKPTGGSAASAAAPAAAEPESDCPSLFDQWYPTANTPAVNEVNRVFNEQCPGFLGWTGVWFTDRWYDLLDVAQLNLSFGRGLGANLHVTELAQVGLNWWDGTAMGMRGRAWGVWETSEWDRGIGPFYWVDVARQPTSGTKSLFNHEYKFAGWDFDENSLNKASHDDWSSVGGVLHLGVVGAEAGLSPLEAVDFLSGLLPLGPVTGWLGMEQPVFDMQRDDTWSTVARELEAEKGLGW